MNHHRSENITRLLSRKQMIEELAVALAKKQTRKLIQAIDENKEKGTYLFNVSKN